MQASLRLLIVWLVALALPVQAVAGVVMAHCVPSHERMHAAHADPHHPHHPSHDAGVHDPHGPGHAQHAATAAPAPDGAAPANKFADLGHYKCSSCASCCAGHALPSAMPEVPAPEPAAADFVAVAFSVAPFATGGPDRPPRPALA